MIQPSLPAAASKARPGRGQTYQAATLSAVEPGKGLQDEIRMLRRLTHQVAELSGEVESAEQAAGLLRELGLAAVRLGRLLKTQQELQSSQSGDDMLQRALSEVLEEMREQGKGNETGGGNE